MPTTPDRHKELRARLDAYETLSPGEQEKVLDDLQAEAQACSDRSRAVAAAEASFRSEITALVARVTFLEGAVWVLRGDKTPSEPANGFLGIAHGHHEIWPPEARGETKNESTSAQ